MSNEISDFGSDVVGSLQSQIVSLQNRVKELEAENAKLSSQLSKCCCHKKEEMHNVSVVECFKPGVANQRKKTGGDTTGRKKAIERIPGYNLEIMTHHSKRYVALKVMYFGQRFYGFASEAQMDPTVESEIFKALEKTRLLVGDKKESQYSRCGRTDKGVSSVGQAMENAGKKFIGDHDFRNFCKMDAANVHNYRRRITLFEISSSNMRFEGNELCAIKVKGSAFLWHQVRCMVAVLFMIGQGLESVDVIDALLDTEKTPSKPQYAMAPEIPLVLQSCEFEDVKFICSSDSRQALCIHFENEGRAYQLQSAIFHEAVQSCLPLTNGQSLLNEGTIKKVASHIPLLSRPTEPSYEERRAKLDSRR
ncbi:hypothetical protein DITRI_Ditri05aG0161000 [Diplodiscus trichospermus]